MPSARKLIAVPLDDLVGAQVDREERVDERQQPAGDHRREQPDDPGAALVGAVDAEERAHQHHPLEADVHDAAALGEHAADAGEDERRREDEHRGDQRRGRPLFRLLGARLRREDAEADPGDARRRPRPSRAGARRASTAQIAAGDREQADEDRPDDRARLDRREREEAGEHAEQEPTIADVARAADALPARVGESAPASCSPSAVASAAPRAGGAPRVPDERMSTSAPTKSTISPWMMYVRFPARPGSITLDCRPWVVPKSSAPKSSAPRTTPTAVLRPSSATAMPRKPTGRDRDVGDAEAVEAAEHVEPAGEAGERARDRHRADQVLAHADPAVARRLGVEADGAHLVAERRPVEDQPEDDERGDRDEEPDVEPLQLLVAPEDGQLRAVGDVVRDRQRRVRRCSGAARRSRTGTCRPRSRSS